MEEIRRQLHEIKKQAEAHIEKKREEERQKKEEEFKLMAFLGNMLAFFGVVFLITSLLFYTFDLNIIIAVKYLIVGFMVGQCGINLMLMSKIKKFEWKL
jgi:hypothetical protein